MCVACSDQVSCPLTPHPGTVAKTASFSNPPHCPLSRLSSSQLVPAEVHSSDRTAFLKSADAILTKATPSVNWFEVGAHMLLAGIDLPDKCDGFQEVTDAKSMRRAVAQVAQHAHSKVQFRVVLKELHGGGCPARDGCGA